jgi:hypothetical protein
MVALDMSMYRVQPGLEVGNPASEIGKKLTGLTSQMSKVPGLKLATYGAVEEYPDMAVLALSIPPLWNFTRR